MRPPSPLAKVLTIQLFVKGVLKSRLNGSGSRAHWSKISQESVLWRARTQVAFIEAGFPKWSGPAAVTFTAYVGRKWDDDNLPAAIKTIRDIGVRLILDTDDGPTCGHRFSYKQEVRPLHERGVLIQVTPL